jgi:hypothetical protein
LRNVFNLDSTWYLRGLRCSFSGNWDACVEITTVVNSFSVRIVSLLFFPGKKITHVACGSAHSLSWSTNKPVNAGKVPTAVPMEYNHLQHIEIPVLRNRLVLLHHFSDLFCPSIPMFDLGDDNTNRLQIDTLTGADLLRGVLVSSAKVCKKI